MKITIQKLFLGAACLVALGASSANAAFLVMENSGNAQIYSSSGTFLSTFASGLSTPVGVAEGGGYVFINQYFGGVGGNGGTTTKYSTTGMNLGIVNSASAANNHNPAGLAWADNRIMSAANGINTLTSSGPDFPSPGAQGPEDGNPATPLSYLFYTPSNSSVAGVASANPNGFTGVYFSYSSSADNSGGVGYWNPGVAAFDSIAAVGAGSTPRGLVTDGSGNLFFALQGSGIIKKRDASGVVTDWKTGLNSPTGLAIDGGNLYVSSFNGMTISGYSLADASFQSSFTTLSNPQYFAISSIPEPGTIGLLAIAGLGLFFARRKRA
jgi:PEP-CTERM motif